MNDLWSFDLKQMMWYELSVTGELPPKRSNHTSNYYDKKNM